MTRSDTRAASAVPFVARVRQALGDFSPTERKLAQCVLDFPINLSAYSASELAQLTGVSNATVTRFIRRLGYDSYEEARRTARSDSGANVPPPVLARHAPAQAPAASPAAPAPAARSLPPLWQQTQTNVATSCSQVPMSVMDAMASALLQAPQIFCVGWQHNHSLAAGMRWQLQQALGKNALLLPGPGDTLDGLAARLGPQDLLMLFALHCEAPLLAQYTALAQQAHTVGAKVVCFIDTATHAPPSQWLLRCQTVSGSAGAEQGAPALYDPTAATALYHGLAAHARQWAQTPFQLV